MAKNTALGNAKKAKQDEFYTQLTDIEKELKHYRQHFADKTVLCNCDDPFESNFFKYFVLNFNRLGLKKLIATSYANSPIMGEQLRYKIDAGGQMAFSFGESGDLGDYEKHPYKAIVNTVYDKTGNDAVEMLDVAELFKSGENELTELDGDGDFRSEECIELLKEADIVVTNPPFSLFREYVAQLMEYEKKFVIIGNINAITYKEFFPLLKENKVWIGASIHSGDRAFYVPDDYPLAAAGCGIDEKGRRFIRVKGIRWFTNLDIKQRHEEMILVKRYNPEQYPKYANYNAIEVEKTADIPCDYDGEMGVPITFLDKYNPDQFEIIGASRWVGNPISEIAPKGSYVSGGMRFYLPINNPEDNIKYRRLYDRIVIRNKHPEV